MALDEVTLVLFTTLAPSGAVALMVMAGVLLFGSHDAATRSRIDAWVCLPLVVTMVGLVASATHLGNPSNALYVFLHVGSSPLSNEVFCAVLFLACGGLYWLYSFAASPLRAVQRLLQVLLLLTGAAFVTAVAFAYSVETVPTWNLPTSPVLLWLNALMGGSLLAALSLYVACWRPLAGRFGRALALAAHIALAANAVGYAVQGALMGGMENAVVTTKDLVPHYWAMCVAALLLAVAGCVLSALALRWVSRAADSPQVAHGSQGAAPQAACESQDPQGDRLPQTERGSRVDDLPQTAQVSPSDLLFSKRACTLFVVACILAFAAIFIMRFAFYMMHLTVGLAV